MGGVDDRGSYIRQISCPTNFTIVLVFRVCLTLQGWLYVATNTTVVHGKGPSIFHQKYYNSIKNNVSNFARFWNVFIAASMSTSCSNTHLVMYYLMFALLNTYIRVFPLGKVIYVMKNQSTAFRAWHPAPACGPAVADSNHTCLRNPW